MRPCRKKPSSIEVIKMKNYYSNRFINEYGYTEVPESEYTDNQTDMKAYIDILSDVIVKAKCGWGEVRYKVMSHHEEFEEYKEEFMVVCADGEEVRWIPITGNSKAYNLYALGDNIW